jgi:hypothetical protein
MECCEYGHILIIYCNLENYFILFYISLQVLLKCISIIRYNKYEEKIMRALVNVNRPFQAN